MHGFRPVSNANGFEAASDLTAVLIAYLHDFL